ncbi:MAG: hypothetical protein JWQ11_3661 [Rhizobacter sp.]|nr:hypothetical protein [Rhizobacter sp.]
MKHIPDLAAVRSAVLAALSVLAAAATLPAIAADEAAVAPVTGHIDLVSRYIMRGGTSTYGNGAPAGNAGGDAPESSRAALQWGADAAFDSGFSVGYWASTLNYSYRQVGRSHDDAGVTDFQNPRSIENDLYGAYNGKLGDLGYTAGLTGYLYVNSRHSSALETRLGLNWGDFAFLSQTLLNDSIPGNSGDTYWTLAWTAALPMHVGFTATLGAYTYSKEGRYFGSRDTVLGTSCAAGSAYVVNGCYAGNAPSGGGFRHLTLAFSGPIAFTPLTWGVQAIVGGETRYGIHQSNRLVGQVTYGF